MYFSMLERISERFGSGTSSTPSNNISAVPSCNLVLIQPESGFPASEAMNSGSSSGDGSLPFAQWRRFTRNGVHCHHGMCSAVPALRLSPKVIVKGVSHDGTAFGGNLCNHVNS